MVLLQSTEGDIGFVFKIWPSIFKCHDHYLIYALNQMGAYHFAERPEYRDVVLTVGIKQHLHAGIR